MNAAAAPDQTVAQLNTISNLGGVGVFRNGLVPAQRLDSVAAFAAITPQAFLIETDSLPALGAVPAEHAWVRKISGTTGSRKIRIATKMILRWWHR
ncbi:MAG: hypothetical protein HOP19_28140 [Acidobacteria bacterium]|nr:hypothetical protein [Acidobacteriota bacterium]